ncbi:MAG: hypothetical protein N3E45_13880 [Oscillatoriaceae bacterium SKW80]|nr:hypothetical protein [Oscillatoriaceae bacterium SKYG93]MCX8121889.1 hypothetical protein [Oscillatoriaceae bacterium SKW80]HIK28644.1 hypothetical protein [Oscillatoriaceae cyanobacterium M7585_C2015_266]
MVLIRQVVEEVLKTGYLTLETEEQLRQLLAEQYDLDDLNAFMLLQHAVMSGRIKQQSRELRRNRQLNSGMTSELPRED